MQEQMKVTWALNLGFRGGGDSFVPSQTTWWGLERASSAPSVSTTPDSSNDLTQFHREWSLKFVGNARKATKLWTVWPHGLLSRHARTKSSLTTDCRPLRASSYTFVELSVPFPHHSITHGIFTVDFTYLAMNVSRFHISCIQKNGLQTVFHSRRAARSSLNILNAQNKT
jgi:hypothetical protein